MPVIAVINRKGGSGKSTMATHLAAWLARQGAAVMLGDVDRQQSTRSWLKRREAQDSPLPGIAPWAMDQKNVLKVPTGVTHVVLDTPGGLHGFELAKVVMASHAILIPVCNSIFDRESASACIAELMALPRLATGRCKLGVVGMRIDARTHAAQNLREWAQALNVPFLGVLRETQAYVRSLDSGQTIFDQRGASTLPDLAQWEPILHWLRPITQLPPAPTHAAPPSAAPDLLQVTGDSKPMLAAGVPKLVSVRSDAPGERMPLSRAPSLMPAQESLVHGSRLSVFSSTPPVEQASAKVLPMTRSARETLGPDNPQFLLRQ
ncbi:MAG: ParA family protein [Pseudomonadota bacterium]